MGIELLNAPSLVLVEYIIEVLGLMTRPSAGAGWPLYMESMPDGEGSKDDAGAVYDTQGIKDGRSLRTGEVFEHFGVQLRIRSRDKQRGFRKIQEIAVALDAVKRDTVSTATETYVIQNVSRGQIASLGAERDSSKRRYIHTVNFLLTVSETEN